MDVPDDSGVVSCSLVARMSYFLCWYWYPSHTLHVRCFLSFLLTRAAMTFQGLMPYYFQILYPNRALELNWCKYNNMGSPVYDIKKNDPTYKVCMTLQDNCEDCRLRPIQNISLVHFTVCQKPWLCMVHSGTTPEHKLCRAFHHEWFQVRSMMEQSWGRSGVGPAKFHNDHFYGYCKSHGQHGYQSLQQPYGLSLTNTT